MSSPLELRGLVVATVLPFTDEGDVDWRSYHRLLEHCAVPDCTAAVFVNGHAGEGAALDDSTRVRVIHENPARDRQKAAAVGGHRALDGGSGSAGPTCRRSRRRL